MEDDAMKNLKKAYQRFFGERRTFGDLNKAEIESVRRIEENGWRTSGLLSSSKALHGFYVGPQYSGGKRLGQGENITRELLYVKPTDELDYIALLHDLEYSLAGTIKDEKVRQKLYREADEIFVKKLKSLETNWGEIFKLLFGGAFFGGLAVAHFESGNIGAGGAALSNALKAAGDLLELGTTTLKGFGAGKYFSNRLEKGDTDYYVEQSHSQKEVEDIINRIMEVGMEEDALFLFKYRPPVGMTEERISALPPPDTEKQQLKRILRDLKLLELLDTF